MLVITRDKHGRRYTVLPGGGVEAGETASHAAIRELFEETGLRGEVLHHLWTLQHADRVAHYFSVAVTPGPLVMSGPELHHASPTDVYQPSWIRLVDLDSENLRPDSVRPPLRALAGTMLGD